MSKVWVQIVADVLGRPLQVPSEVDSAYGAALLGLVGLGLARDLRAVAEAQWGRGKLVEPIEENVGLYDARFGAYLRVHERLAPLYHDGWPR